LENKRITSAKLKTEIFGMYSQEGTYAVVSETQEVVDE
jgi:hypothetical protein